VALAAPTKSIATGWAECVSLAGKRYLPGAGGAALGGMSRRTARSGAAAPAGFDRRPLSDEVFANLVDTAEAGAVLARLHDIRFGRRRSGNAVFRTNIPEANFRKSVTVQPL
jgi:hypothetical protein